MLKTIFASYKSFFKNFPLILVYALPLLVLSFIEAYFEGITAPSRSVMWFLTGMVYIMPFISASTDVAVYQRLLLKLKKVNPFSSLKILFEYLFVQLGIGFLSVIPLYVVYYILNRNSGPTLSHLCIAIFANIFTGFYFMARFNIMLPLIILKRNMPLKEFLSFTQERYQDWLLTSLLIYTPFVVLVYLVANPFLNAFVTTLFALVFVCFNITYLNSKTSVKEKTAATTKVAVKKRTANKATAPKVAPVKKTESKEKAPKKPAKTTASKKASEKKQASAEKTKKATSVKTKRPGRPKLKPAIANA